MTKRKTKKKIIWKEKIRKINYKVMKIKIKHTYLPTPLCSRRKEMRKERKKKRK